MKAIAVLLAAGMLLTALAPASPAAPVQKVTITMTDFRFTPNAVTVKAGSAVEATLVNRGAVQHEFMLYPPPSSMGGMAMDMDAYGAKNTYFKGIGAIEVISGGKTSKTSGLERVMVDPGKSLTIKFVAKKSGVFEFGCHITGHYEAGMKGTLTVK